MPVLISVFFIAVFSVLNAFVWVEFDRLINIFGGEISTYILAWYWIGMIAVVCGVNHLYHYGTKHMVGNVIAVWWASNLAIIHALQEISPRDVGEQSELVPGVSNLVHDFIFIGGVDLVALVAVLTLVKLGRIGFSVWASIFIGFLVLNLVGHALGAYRLLAGDMPPDAIAQLYDTYLYELFTLMLIIQSAGSSLDALLKRTGTNVDIYADVRSDIRNASSRDLHLH